MSNMELCEKCNHKKCSYEIPPCNHCVNNPQVTNYYEDKTKEWRAYETAEEFIADYKKRFNNSVIWVKLYENPNDEYYDYCLGEMLQVLSYGTSFVRLSCGQVSLEELFERFRYADDSLCGVFE